MLIKKKCTLNKLYIYIYIYSRTYNFLIKHESFKIFVVRSAQIINWSIAIEDNCTMDFTYIKFIFWPISKSKKKQNKNKIKWRRRGWGGEIHTLLCGLREQQYQWEVSWLSNRESIILSRVMLQTQTIL